MVDSITIAARSAGRVHGWDAAHLTEAELEYRRFVDLARQHPGEPIVPSVDVDLVWHEHLDSGDAPRHDTHSSAHRDDRFARTLALYAEHVGLQPGPLWAEVAECQVEDVPPPD